MDPTQISCRGFFPGSFFLASVLTVFCVNLGKLSLSSVLVLNVIEDDV